jgi:hypothetical protein
MQVFGAFSTDGGATWKNEKLIYASPEGNICPCCQPSVYYDPRGGLHVMWRNDLKGDRDMYLSSSTDGGKTFGAAIKLGAGAWTIKQCPMDGGALAADARGELTTIWRRDQKLFSCVPGSPERLLGTGEQGWAATGSDGVYLAWIRQRPGALLVLAPGGGEPLVLAREASDPVLAGPVNGQGPVVLVWEEGPKGKTQLRAAVLRPAIP